MERKADWKEKPTEESRRQGLNLSRSPGRERILGNDRTNLDKGGGVIGRKKKRKEDGGKRGRGEV